MRRLPRTGPRRGSPRRDTPGRNGTVVSALQSLRTRGQQADARPDQPLHENRIPQDRAGRHGARVQARPGEGSRRDIAPRGRKRTAPATAAGPRVVYAFDHRSSPFSHAAMSALGSYGLPAAASSARTSTDAPRITKPGRSAAVATSM